MKRSASPVSVRVASIVQRLSSLDQLAAAMRWPVADVAAEIVLVDDLAQVAEDLGGGRDRRAGPRLEAVAEGVEVAVGADAGKLCVRQVPPKLSFVSRTTKLCPGTASSGDRRRRCRRCRRRRSGRRSARTSLDTPAARSSRRTSLPSIAKGSNGGDSGSAARHCSIGSLAADLARLRAVEEPGLTLTAAEFEALADRGRALCRPARLPGRALRARRRRRPPALPCARCCAPAARCAARR